MPYTTGRTAVKSEFHDRKQADSAGCRETSLPGIEGSLIRMLAFQRVQIGAVINVVGLAIEHESRYRFNSGALGFRDARFVGAEVNYLDFVAITIERLRNVLLRINTNRATSVVENSFGFHIPILLNVTKT
jgi:hypothetical protein